MQNQRTLTFGGRITVRLVSSLTCLDSTEQENMLLFVRSKSIESKPEKTLDQLYCDPSSYRLECYLAKHL